MMPLGWLIEICDPPFQKQPLFVIASTTIAPYFVGSKYVLANCVLLLEFIVKRDMNIIRKLMLAIEESDGSEMSDLDGVDNEVFGYHARLLDTKGWIPKKEVSTLTGDGPDGCCSRVYQTTAGWHITEPELTWDGCEFLDTIRDETVWKSVRTRIDPVKSVPLSILVTVATEYLKSKVGLS